MPGCGRYSQDMTENYWPVFSQLIGWSKELALIWQEIDLFIPLVTKQQQKENCNVC